MRMAAIKPPVVKPPPVDNVDYLKVLQDLFSGTQYGAAPELQNILQKYATTQNPAGYRGGPDQWTTDVKSTIDRYANTFQKMFQDKVGRPPTSDEYNTFFQNVVTTDQPWATPADFTRVNEETKSALSDFFTTAAQEQAQKQATEASAKAVAPGSAFDQWSNSYRGSLSGVEKSLADFQSRLMEKIRPQLLTSLQSQGLLDTGGLNEAFAGKASDLTSSAQNYIANARSGVEQDIANQKYNLLSLPYQQQSQYTLGAIPNLTSMGQNALQNVWNQNMMNQQNAFNERMYNEQMSNQPSLLQQYGGMMLGGIAGGAGQGFGRRLAGGR